MRYLAGAIIFVAAALVTSVIAQSNFWGRNYGVIDGHVHLDFSDTTGTVSQGISYTADEFLKETKAAGVTGFVEHTASLDSVLPNLPGLTPTFCIGIHDDVNVARIEDGLRTGKFQCIKIYLGYAFHFPSDALYAPLYDLAEKYAVPVVFHTGDTFRSNAKVKFADPLGIDEVAVDHPNVTMVIAHCGNPWFHSAAEVAYKNPNVYVDASGIVIGDLKKYGEDDVSKYLIEPVKWVFGYIENSSKMFFGTDWPLVNIKSYLNAVVGAIPPEHQKEFLHDNAIKIFHIKEH